MSEPAAPPPSPDDRRLLERRVEARLVEMSLPEVRRALITAALSLVVLGLFLWMVRPVIIAGLLGVIAAAYLRPLYRALLARTGHPVPAALLTLTALLVPVIVALLYSYLELREVALYLVRQPDRVAEQIDAALHRLPFLAEVDTGDTVRQMVNAASNYGARIPGAVSEGIGQATVAAAVFLFTAFYLLTEGGAVARYLVSKIPPRYAELTGTLERNIRGVLYGAVYSTLLTQGMKSVVVLVLFLLFGVPLAVVLSILSFVIGFFPIVGSWSVYLPVAVWLLIFRDAPWSALAVVSVGFAVNTLFLSFYLRPKIAAEKSRVLNFYWMFVGLVTGVYTFGLAGILLGPILIGMLKAILDTVSTPATWRLIDEEGRMLDAADPRSA